MFGESSNHQCSGPLEVLMYLENLKLRSMQLLLAVLAAIQWSHRVNVTWSTS